MAERYARSRSFWQAIAMANCAVPLLLLVADTAWALRSGWRPSPLILAALCAVVLFIAMARRRVHCDWRHAAPRGLLLLAALLTAAVAAEWWLRATNWHAAFHLRRPGLSFQLTPDPVAYPGASPRARVSYDAYGFRGTGVSGCAKQSTRVFCLGGSTTECLFLDDAATWPARLQAILDQSHPARFCVLNAGHCDYAAAQHARFVRESPLVRSQDMVVALVGASDLMRYVFQFDLGGERPPRWQQSALAKLARDVWNGPLRRGMYVDPTGVAYAHARGKLSFTRNQLIPDIRYAAAQYELRIRQLASAARRRGAQLVLVTQPVLWQASMPPEAMPRLVVCRVLPFPGPWRWLTAAHLREAIDQFNAATRRVAIEYGVPLVEADELHAQLDCFYDDYHLTVHGADALAQLIADRLLTDSGSRAAVRQ
jgi:lysophospholipase L1-like esterase